MLQPPPPVQTLSLFADDRAALLQLLASLDPGGWERPTVCSNWSVKDVALHILGGDLANISLRRDSFFGLSPAPGEDFVPFINRINEGWVHEARRISPRLLIDLLAFSGPQLFAYFDTLDLDQVTAHVSWAGPDPSPVWLDVAREYTERWFHQQHIRDAVGKPGQTDRRFLAPVLDTFVYALPHTYRNTPAPQDTAIHLHITGEAGGEWSIVREDPGWTLYEGTADNPTTTVSMDQSTAWRLLTKGLTPEAARSAISFAGDQTLGEPIFQAIAIIA
ncbi:MAG TPA: maleylpyruvate isomerase family mycothiol-dependent enzyme [Chloroflexia bacterium]|nr:maleylpyruvate isomerase family mycothiol-dependent enzyme [Chloroflexia bacterium]